MADVIAWAKFRQAGTGWPAFVDVKEIAAIVQVEEARSAILVKGHAEPIVVDGTGDSVADTAVKAQAAAEASVTEGLRG